MKCVRNCFVLSLLVMSNVAMSQVFTDQLFCYKPAEWKNLDAALLGPSTGFFCTISRGVAPTVDDKVWVLSAGLAFPVPFPAGQNTAGFPEIVGSEVKALCLPGQFILSPPANGCVSKITPIHFGDVAGAVSINVNAPSANSANAPSAPLASPVSSPVSSKQVTKQSRLKRLLHLK